MLVWQAGGQAESNGNHDFGPLEGGNSGIFGGSGAGSFGGGSAGGFGGSFGNAPVENGNTSTPAMVSHTGTAALPNENHEPRCAACTQPALCQALCTFEAC